VWQSQGESPESNEILTPVCALAQDDTLLITARQIGIYNKLRAAR